MQGTELQRVGVQEYEGSYLKDVLGLEEGVKEEEMDERLIAEAKKLGIDVAPLAMKDCLEEENTKRPASMPVLPTEALPPRRSSVDSRASVATSMMSTASSIPRTGHGVAASRASLSFRDYDNFLARGRPEGRASMSFSPPTTPSASAAASVFSLPMSSPESSPKKQYRLMRGLSLLKRNRVDSAMSSRGCPHCPKDPLSQRRAVHKLPCGHRLCTKALRDTIIAATTNGAGAIPSCCGLPIPGCLVEHVMTQHEQSAVLDRLDQWSRGGSATPSMKSEARGSFAMQRPGALSTASRTASDESKVDSVAQENRQTAKSDEERPEMKKLRKEQAELRDRFTSWIQRQRGQLAEKHERWRVDLRTTHETSAERLEEIHAQAMSEAEDKQVNAEADMRALHAQESRDTDTALKHMEAYCAGTYVSTGEPHGRKVTQQDVLELEHARRMKEGLSNRQASAINVLRGEQDRRLRLRGQRQEKEMLELRRGQRREELEAERAWTEEGRVFDDFVKQRWRVLSGRWEIAEKVLVRRLESEEDGEGAEADRCDGRTCGSGEQEGPGGVQAMSGAAAGSCQQGQ